MTSLASIVLGVALLTTQPPAELPFSTARINGKWHKIYWTVDDHPHRTTSAVLQLFNQYQLKATFFVVTNDLYWYVQSPNYAPAKISYRRLLRIKRAGHLIGNHSYSHGRLCKKSYRQLLTTEVGRTQRILQKLTGVLPTLWRPPHGETCSQLRRAVAHYKLTWVMWHISDWRVDYKTMWYDLQQRVRKNYKETIILVHHNTWRLRRLLRLIYPNQKAP